MDRYVSTELRLCDTDKIFPRNEVFIVDDVYEEIVEQLPSAQPEITDEQAIEHLQESGWMQNHDKQMYEMGLREQLADDSDSYDALLPSAQPEIIRCKDCKHYKAKQGNLPWKNSRRYCNKGVTLATNPDDFCSFAERRTDG